MIASAPPPLPPGLAWVPGVCEGVPCLELKTPAGCFAAVWAARACPDRGLPARATWHTFDARGIGGENGVERGEDSGEVAQAEAWAALLRQGWVTGPAPTARRAPKPAQPLLFDAPAMVPAPALYGADGKPVLGVELPCLALDQPYAGLLFGEEPGEVGPKSLESRLWPWPYPPGWLAIFATKNPDRGAYARIYGAGWRDVHHIANDVLGAILGIVWIAGCRRMTAEDSAAACFPFDPTEETREGRPRLVWPIGAAYRFPRPDRTTLKRGPQKFQFLPRDVIAAGLGGSPS